MNLHQLHNVRRLADNLNDQITGCNPLNTNDLVDDTAQMASPSSGCPVNRDSCPDLDGLDPIHNYMDYAADSCQDNFTPGQFDRIYSEFDLYRRDLPPFGCSPDTEAIVTLDILMDDTPQDKDIWVSNLATGNLDFLFIKNELLVPSSANKRFVRTVCISENDPLAMVLVDNRSPVLGFQDPGYYSLSINGREILRGTEMIANFYRHTFSPGKSECGTNPRWELEILNDEWPYEVTFDLRKTDSNNQLIVDTTLFEGNQEAVSGDKNALLWVERCLAPGSYTFTIYDSANDGIFAPGYYQLKLDGTVIHTGDGSRYSSQTFSFDVSAREAVTTPAPVQVATPRPTVAAPIPPPEDDSNNDRMAPKSTTSILRGSAIAAAARSNSNSNNGN